ncbi:MAG: methyltransferase domain-containing protein [Nitrospinae bacterium]|nr:methyltransferase domain-containing protein [Nitrospinota bacterium]
MSKIYSTNYWSFGFQSNLYDILSPESYFESMRRLVATIPEGKSIRLLDAGCGSGLLLNFLAGRIREGMIYTGVDLLKTGVEQTLFRAKKLGLADQVSSFESDLTVPLPMIEEEFDVVVGHFSLYTLQPSEKRQAALANLKKVISSGGVLILVNPSVDYDPVSIIEESLRLVRDRQGLLPSFLKQALIYPFTKGMGLRFIQKQLKRGEWKAFTREELSHEIAKAGFAVRHIEQVYAGSAFLITGKMT